MPTADKNAGEKAEAAFDKKTDETCTLKTAKENCSNGRHN